MRRRTGPANPAASPASTRDAAGSSWRARPRLATAVRLLVLCGPIALSVAAAVVASRLVAPPAGSILLSVGWCVVLSGAATVVLLAASRLLRRLLPLAALLRLSLLFPDGAPSRFSLALRTATVSTLEERLADARAGGSARTPVEEAERLLELVALLDEHDPLTRGHSERVRAYAQSIGRELGLDRDELDLLNWAALLHDVGKLDVPHEILTKSGRPTESEWEILRGHPEAGARLVSALGSWLGEWGAAIEEHHERWDGEGYPRGLAGTEISLAGRIVAVADVFDVITSSRTYKQSGSVAEARIELSRCAGTQFDPDVVRAFLSISVRQGRLAGPLAWLAHATMLFRLPVPHASGLSAGAAVVAVGTALGTGVTAQPLEHATPPSGLRAVSATPIATRPAAVPAHPLSAPPRSVAKSAHVPKSRRHASHAAPAPLPESGSRSRRSGSVAREADPAEQGAESIRPAEPTPPKPSETPKPPKLAEAPTPTTLAKPKPAPPRRAPAVPSTPPPPTGVGELTEGLGSLTGDLTDDLGTITGDVTSLVDDVAAVPGPGSSLPDDVSSVVDGVSTLTEDVTAILIPPPAQPPETPPGAPQPSGDPKAEPSLVEGLLSTLRP